MAHKLFTTAGLSVLCTLGATSAGQPLTARPVARDLSLPLYVTAPRGDFNRLFIVEQRAGAAGRVRILNLPAESLDPAPYLSIDPVGMSGEQGLLGLAFHPDFLSNGYFWVYYTGADGNNFVARYRANPPYATSTAADPSSATPVLTILHPTNDNHNGGWIAFAPGDTQGYLFIATGDGGGSPNGNAQNTSSLLGKMLRIDVDGPDNIPGNADDDGFPADPARLYTIPPTNPFAGGGGAREVYDLGLRNPWRASFDRANGDLYIGDPGEETREEIDFVLAGDASLKNFGWCCMEGFACTGYGCCACNAPTLTRPIYDYPHPAAACAAVIGGYVYRGCLIPQLRGAYFFADLCSDRIFSFPYPRSGLAPAPTDRTVELTPGTGPITTISSFGEDADGELYIVSLDGVVYRIVRADGFSRDCNADGADDGLERCRGWRVACCGSADFDCDGHAGTDADIAAFFACLAGRCPGAPCAVDADFNADGDVATDADIEAFFRVLAGGGC